MPYKDPAARAARARERQKHRLPYQVRSVAAYHAAVRAFLAAEREAQGCALAGPGCSSDLTFDHIIPRAVAGGRKVSDCHSWRTARAALADPNIQVLCGYHNSRKGTK